MLEIEKRTNSLQDASLLSKMKDINTKAYAAMNLKKVEDKFTA